MKTDGQLLPRLSGGVERAGVLSVAAQAALVRSQPAAIALLAVATFLPVPFVHPFRVQRCRALTVALLVVWSVLASVALARDMMPGPWITAALCAIALYFLGVGLCRTRNDSAMLELLTDPNAWAALVTLTALEIVLGIDNIVFISVLVSRCSPKRGEARAPDRARARAGVPHHLAVRPDLADEADLSGVLAVRPRILLARHHPDRRRPVPDRQGDARNPRRGRGG